MRSEILAYLPGDHPWQNHIQWFDSIDSTNTRAKLLAAQGAPHGTVLIADHQTGGRGRLGRSFHSPEGVGVYMSVILRLECAPDRLMHLTCAAAVAACDAVHRSTGIRPGIKWTNDLVSGKRKLAGILTELVSVGGITYAIIGIGINCCQKEVDFPEQIRGFAGSLAMVTGQRIDRARVAAGLIEAFCSMSDLLLTDQAAILERYRADCITLGQDVSILRCDELLHAHACSIDSSGALVVRFPDGRTEAVQSGEVSVRGMYGYL